MASAPWNGRNTYRMEGEVLPEACAASLLCGLTFSFCMFTIGRRAFTYAILASWGCFISGASVDGFPVWCGGLGLPEGPPAGSGSDAVVG